MVQHIVPFVDHEIGCRLLQKLITHSDTSRFEVPAVVTTQENGKAWWPDVREICMAANIPLLVYEESFAVDHRIRQADWFLLLSWKHILPVDLINFPKRGVLNLHYSLLPCYRGVYPVNWAIINGEHRTGFTYHFVNDEIDDGEIFMQVDLPVYKSDTARTLQLRLDDLVCDHFDQLIERILNYERGHRHGNTEKKRYERADYFSRREFEQACLIDLDKSYLGIEFFNLLRGLTFLEDSKNAYVLDKESGKKLYVSINIREEK